MVLAILTACQSSDDNEDGAKTNPPPVVIIGKSKQIFEDQDLVLFAEATDDGEIVSYVWNSKANNKNIGNKALLTVAAPHTVGQYKYAISVTDNDQQVTTKVITVTIKARSDSPPIISMKPSKVILDNQDLEIFADATDDGTIVSYLWSDEKGKNIGNTSLLELKAPHDIGKQKYYLTVTDDKSQSSSKVIEVTVKDSKYLEASYEVKKYAVDKLPHEYKMEQIDDSSFNLLSNENKYKVADKLLSSLFFAYNYDELTRRIGSGTFISDIQSQLLVTTNTMPDINNKVRDKSQYYQHERNAVPEFLSRFYEMSELDKAYFNHWISYMLTQTILFSPAVELGSVAQPDAFGVYNRLYNFQDQEISMRYATFMHMQSNENWRRFRSPEDNGREMLEIYALNNDDAAVPVVAQALKNWSLNTEANTLVVSLNKNTELLSIMDDMTFTTGVEFYASLAKSKAFTKGITSRLVDIMFTDDSRSKKAGIIAKIVSSNPESWKDIMAQIIFSKEYLLQTKRTKSVEELVFPLMKKLQYNSYYYTFNSLHYDMKEMGQASMSYKLGKLTRVPLDNISFATYQKYLRDRIFRLWSKDTPSSLNPKKPLKTKEGVILTSEMIMNNPKSVHRRGISAKKFVSNFKVVEDNYDQTISNQVNYLFKNVLNRNATNEEVETFIKHIKDSSISHYINFINDDKNYQTHIRSVGRVYVQYQVFEYMIRLDELYFYKNIKK